MQDREYINRFQAGDFEAFWLLYEKYIDAIFAYVYRKTSDRELAEDLTSRVWMKALRSLEFFWDKENAGFKSWIYCIASNTVIDYYRTKKEKVDIDSIIESGITYDFAREIDAKDNLQEVLSYMESLKWIEKEIVTLRIWDDMSYADIAKVVDKKPDSCKKILSRALKKISANIALVFVILLIL